MKKGMNLLKRLSKLSENHKLYMGILLLILVIAVFIPRDTPLLALGLSGRIGNLSGKVNLETFSSESKEDFAKAKKSSSFCFFYAPWCGWCKKAKPEWEKLVKSNDTDINLLAINADEKKDLAKKFGVQGFPTFKLFKRGMDNGMGETYKGERTAHAMKTFLKEAMS